jgi:NTE family protein
MAVTLLGEYPDAGMHSDKDSRGSAPTAEDTRKIGLALGSGGARGAAHSGVLKVLDREGIKIQAIAGSSIGALVGAAYALGLPVEEMEREWLATDVPKLLRGFLPTFPRAGLSSGSELRKLLINLLGDGQIEEMPIPFAAVACDFDSGEEVVLRKGGLADAVRASTAVPGLFHPVRWEGRLLVDGGMVDPVPIAVCRELGVDAVIAVDITPPPIPTTERARGVWQRIGEHVGELSQRPWVPGNLAEYLDGAFRERVEHPLPGLYSILNQSISILLQEVVRLRALLHPADLTICPQLSLSTMSYLRAKDGIAAGEQAAEAALPAIRELIAR